MFLDKTIVLEIINNVKCATTAVWNRRMPIRSQSGCTIKMRSVVLARIYIFQAPTSNTNSNPNPNLSIILTPSLTINIMHYHVKCLGVSIRLSVFATCSRDSSSPVFFTVYASSINLPYQHMPFHDPGRTTVYLLRDLHWLPIHSRTTFKIALLCYKGIHFRQPEYLVTELHT